MCGLTRGLLLLAALAAVLCLAAGSAPARPARTAPTMAEVVVTLASPPLARSAAAERRLGASAGRTARLNLRAPATLSRLSRIDAQQRALEARIRAAIPQARVRWRYSVVLNGLAVVVPERQVERLRAVRGVADVYPSVRYRPQLDRGPAQIGAPALWGTGLATAGNGIKIGIIDDGVDQTHPFFDPGGFAIPAGYPRGNLAFTTAKVIVARAFVPAGATYPNASLPFDPDQSDHATHVAGIAAGNSGTAATTFPGRPTVSGVAPRAYIGNYKVLTIPTPRVGLDGNSPEIVAGIEAAVRDGMDVINLSLGEPEIEPRRDIVVAAINGAADAGVVPAIAAGNDFTEFGRGSVGSPGSAEKAITAAAVSTSRGGPANVVAGFSSSGPTPVSLQLKPDVSAPGENILSSVPNREGSWAVFSGTSMASPHVAGAAALLRQRHPSWTVAQVKSALVLTGDPTRTEGADAEAQATREGGGAINLVRANDPRIFATPTNMAFGMLRRGQSASRAIELADAGGGTGEWSVRLVHQAVDPRITPSAPASVTVPGRLQVSVSVAAGAPERELTGFVVLSRGGETRRIPYWLRVTAPQLGRHRTTALRRTGTYRGNTRGRPALVTTYRYPDDAGAAGIIVRLPGPEQVFRVRLARPAENLGVAVLSRASGVAVHPRIVVAGDENRLTGYTALPLNMNPYTIGFGRSEPTAAALRPAAGSYDVVFDTTGRTRAGRFTFRFWIGDGTPPALRLLTPTAGAGGLTVSAVDGGAGVDPRSVSATVNGLPRPAAYSRARNRITVGTTGLPAGRHTLVLQVSDYQETKNNENTGPILPNTRVLRTTFTVR
jgi:subtilisin family serine protease